MTDAGGHFESPVSAAAAAVGAAAPAPPPPPGHGETALRPACVPVLAYAPITRDRRAWVRRPIWAALSLALAIAYPALAVGGVLMLALLNAEGGSHELAIMCFVSLVVTAPLGVIALALGILGHFSPGGRRCAGPAIWIVALTPGALAMATVLLGNAGGLGMTMMGWASAVVVVDTLLITLLRGRILKARPEELAAAHASRSQ